MNDPMTEKTENLVRAAIDRISESIRINGCEDQTTEFLVNFLTGNVPMIADMIMEDEEADESEPFKNGNLLNGKSASEWINDARDKRLAKDKE